MSNLNDDLDMSWIVETERLSKIDQNFARENMNEIRLHSIYINKTNHIDKIVSTIQPLAIVDLSNMIMGFTNDFVIKLVENSKTINGIKYKLLDILVFNVDLEPENIQTFSQIKPTQLDQIKPTQLDQIKPTQLDQIKPTQLDQIKPTQLELPDFSCRFLKTYSVIQDIKIPASIFIFHNLNAIYMIFQELVLLANPYTSILKKMSGSNISGSNINLHLRKTKKVSIDDSHLLMESNHKKTKKHYLVT